MTTGRQKWSDPRGAVAIATLFDMIGGKSQLPQLREHRMARGEIILRQWNLLNMLQTRGEGVPLRDIAEQFEVSERTIQRDFEILQELGFPIDFEDDEIGKRFWRMPHDFFKTGPLVLSLTEAVSLHLAEGLIDPLAGTHFADGLETLLEKIHSLVPRKALDHFAALDDVLLVRRIGQTDYSRYSETIRTIANAARSEETIEMTYRSLWRGSSYTTLCDPYGMVIYEADLFLVGKSHRADAIRIFKITRIDQVVAASQSFTRPAEFSLEHHFKDSFGITKVGGDPVEIVVKLTGPAAALVDERIWHESQRLAWLPAEETLFEPAPDEPETLMATFHLSDTAEFKRWLSGFGDQAKVLKPDWLRHEMQEELLAAARQYDE